MSIVYHVKVDSPLWSELHKADFHNVGCITISASQMSKILFIEDGAERLVKEFRGEKQPLDLSNNPYVQHGRDHEAEAVLFLHDLDVSPLSLLCYQPEMVLSVSKDHKYAFGATADSFFVDKVTNEYVIVEVKCPVLRECVMQQSYYIQIQMQLMLYKRDLAYCFVYKSADDYALFKVKRNIHVIPLLEWIGFHFINHCNENKGSPVRWRTVTTTPLEMVSNRNCVKLLINRVMSLMEADLKRIKNLFL